MSAARRRRVRSLAVLLGVSSGTLTTTAGALPAPARTSGHAGEPRSIAVEGRVTQPFFSYEYTVREHREVRTTLDSDGDGSHDRVAIDVIRPRATERGLRVPVVMDAGDDSVVTSVQWVRPRHVLQEPFVHQRIPR